MTNQVLQSFQVIQVILGIHPVQVVQENLFLLEFPAGQAHLDENNILYLCE